MDNELLIKLLNSNNRLVIPDFGAFLKKEQGDSTIIVFTPFLKKDDGILKKAIADNFSLEEEDASAMISEYVGDINKRLSNNGSYYIDNLGVFKLDLNGVMTFLHEPKSGSIAPEQPQPTTQETSSLLNEDMQVEQQPINQRFINNENTQEKVSEPHAPTTEQQSAPKPVTFPTQQPQINQSQQAAPKPVNQIPRPIQAPRPATAATQPQQAQSPVNPTTQPQQAARPTTPTNQPQQTPRPAIQASQPQQAPRPEVKPPVTPVQQPNRQPQRPTAPQGQRPAQRPVAPRPSTASKKSIFQKTDVWLIAAIVVALIVLCVIVYSYRNAEPEIILEPMNTEQPQTYLTKY